VTVQLTVDGTPRALPPGLDLAAYRIVQEALTNVRRHAPGTTARVTVGHRAEAITIEVRNPVQEPVDARPGQGLRGMAERAALYDGTLDAGARDGEFVVMAQLPAPEPP
jgi:signal transduction histidine kinase